MTSSSQCSEENGVNAKRVRAQSRTTQRVPALMTTAWRLWNLSYQIKTKRGWGIHTAKERGETADQRVSALEKQECG